MWSLWNLVWNTNTEHICREPISVNSWAYTWEYINSWELMSLSKDQLIVSHNEAVHILHSHPRHLHVLSPWVSHNSTKSNDHSLFSPPVIQYTKICASTSIWSTALTHITNHIDFTPLNTLSLTLSHHSMNPYDFTMFTQTFQRLSTLDTVS